jgi:hypothetical protein
MIPRTMTLTFVGALAIGAYAAGCGSGDPTGTGQTGEYRPGNTASSGSSSGNAASSSTGGSSGGSSSGTASSSGSSSGGSSGGSSGSSGGTAEAGAPVEAGPAPVTLDEAFAQFAACMSFSDFTNKTTNGAAAADIAKSQTTQYGDCNACHNAGDGGFWASYGTVQGQNMEQVMFTQTQAFPYIAKWITGTVDSNGNFKDLAPSNSIADQATLAAQCTAGTPCHPKFQLNPAVAQAITDFVTLTITKWHSNACTGNGLPSDAGLGAGG